MLITDQVAIADPRMILGPLEAKPLSTTLLRQNFKSAAMLWTDQLEVATVKCENARDVQTFRYRNDQRVYKIELGIGILPENLCGARVISLTRTLESSVLSPQDSR